MAWFRKDRRPRTSQRERLEIPADVWDKCEECGHVDVREKFERGFGVCPSCGHHRRIDAAQYIALLTDEGSFEPMDQGLRSVDALGFEHYRDRLAAALKKAGREDAVRTGVATLEGEPIALAVMDFKFMGGSMGSAVGEKFSRACDSALERGVPLVSVTSSGGARMQEGILSLMQLPKTVCAVEDLHDARIPVITVMAHPTTAGVLASFASLGDVTIAEPGSLIAFTGPRVVQQTTREKLPDDFGLAEQNLRFGHLDAIIPRAEQLEYLNRVLRLFA